MQSGTEQARCAHSRREGFPAAEPGCRTRMQRHGNWSRGRVRDGHPSEQYL